MLTWGTRRKLIFLGIAISIVVLAIVLPTAVTVYKPATCSDGKQNQRELGVDCGGPCTRLCEIQSINTLVLWQRIFPVAPGIYNAIAYLENPNLNSGAKDVSYSFKLYDDRNILIAERLSSTFIPPRRVVPIFEGGISTGNRQPVRGVFAFESIPVWVTLIGLEPELRVTGQNMKDVSSIPLLTARVNNESNTSLHDIEAVAIIYDEHNNARAASKTIIDVLKQASSANVTFSWPAAFDFVPTRIEIVPKIYPGINY